MTNHSDFVTYIGLEQGPNRRCYRSHHNGLSYFGAYHATAEIVATKDTEFSFSCVYLGGIFMHSIIQRPRMFPSHGRQCSSITVGFVGQWRSPDPGGSASATTFHSIHFSNGGDNASDVEIGFAGGGQILTSGRS
jgi:hypothetical protein